MNKNELKAILMAIMAPNGIAVNFHKQTLENLDKNAEQILTLCHVEDKHKSSRK